MGCSCNPNTPEPTVNMEPDKPQANEEGPIVAAKTGNLGLAVIANYLNVN